MVVSATPDFLPDFYAGSAPGKTSGSWIFKDLLLWISLNTSHIWWKEVQGLKLECWILSDHARLCWIMLDSAGSCRNTPGSSRNAGYCRIMPDSARSGRILSDHAGMPLAQAGFCRIMSDSAGSWQNLPDHARLCQIMPDSAVSCQVMPYFSWFKLDCRIMPDSAGLYWTLPDHAGFFLIKLDSPRPGRTLPTHAGLTPDRASVHRTLPDYPWIKPDYTGLCRIWQIMLDPPRPGQTLSTHAGLPQDRAGSCWNMLNSAGSCQILPDSVRSCRTTPGSSRITQDFAEYAKYCQILKLGLWTNFGFNRELY